MAGSASHLSTAAAMYRLVSWPRRQ